METFNKWFLRFLWGTDVVLLLASTPHIAAWYEHFDNPVGVWPSIYAWSVGYGLAIAIDGVSLMLLMALTRLVNQEKKKSGWVTFGLLMFMSFIVLLSWYINWQYDTQYASTAFAKADAVVVYQSITIGSINPIIGGAFQVLILAYALIGKAMKSEVKSVSAMSDEEFEKNLKRIQQEKALKDARKGPSIWEKAKEAKQGISELIHQGNDDESTKENTEEHDQENRTSPKKKIERITGPLEEENEGESAEKEQGLLGGNDQNTVRETSESIAIDPTLMPLISRYPKVVAMLSTSGSTVDLAEVANVFEVTVTLLRNRVKTGKIRRTKSAEIVYKDSVVSWAKTEMLSKQKGKIIDLETARNSQGQAEEIVNG